ncbi:hypothetical protein [Methylovulum miyakonense]|uniref:hypothetical protein n=1 Tax=Methylovulum miyakonense TaxID=645578 RepID=UPI00037B5708|nr:hypothetical protein [Methylovulum miyakonense]
MTDPVTITTSVLASFTHANNLIKAILDARDTLASLEKLNALQAEISSINTGYFSLLQQNTSMLAEVDNLKKEIARFETWESEKTRYKLTQIGMGVVAYALKEAEANGEPPHWVCTNCFGKSKKFILNGTFHNNIVTHMCSRDYKCTECGFVAKLESNSTPSFV